MNDWEHCATCPTGQPQTLKQFGGKWWKPSLWPSAIGFSSTLCSLSRNRGRMWPNVETETSPPSNCAVQPCLVIDGQSGRCSHKEVVHLKLPLLIFAAWQPAESPKSFYTHTHIHAHKNWSMSNYKLNPVHKYRHMQKKKKSHHTICHWANRRFANSVWMKCECFLCYSSDYD